MVRVRLRFCANHCIQSKCRNRTLFCRMSISTNFCDPGAVICEESQKQSMSRELAGVGCGCCSKNCSLVSLFQRDRSFACAALPFSFAAPPSVLWVRPTFRGISHHSANKQLPWWNLDSDSGAFLSAFTKAGHIHWIRSVLCSNCLEIELILASCSAKRPNKSPGCGAQGFVLFVR